MSRAPASNGLGRNHPADFGSRRLTPMFAPLFTQSSTANPAPGSPR